MKTYNKITHNDIMNWASEAKLALPDQWEGIKQCLSQREKQSIPEKNIGFMIDQPIIIGRRRLIAWAGLAVLILIGGLIISGRIGELLGIAYIPKNHFTQATVSYIETNESAKPATSASTYSEEQLAFSDKANAQFALMEQAHIPDQYQYYAGCYMEDLRILVINVTCEPDEFKVEFADLLDFSIIEVRKVKYTLKELESAYEPLYKEFIGTGELSRLDIFGMAVFEQDNAIRIVVQEVNTQIRNLVADIISDTGMVVFEVDGEIIRY